MSAFDAPIFDKAIADEARTGENQGVALTAEETGKHFVIANKPLYKSLLPTLFLSSWFGGAMGGAGYMVSTILVESKHIATSDIVAPLTITAGIVGLGTAFIFCAEEELKAARKARRNSRAILKAGVRPLTEGEVLPPDRKSVNISKLARAARELEKNTGPI